MLTDQTVAVISQYIYVYYIITLHALDLPNVMSIMSSQSWKKVILKLTTDHKKGGIFIVIFILGRAMFSDHKSNQVTLSPPEPISHIYLPWLPKALGRNVNILTSAHKALPKIQDLSV